MFTEQQQLDKLEELEQQKLQLWREMSIINKRIRLAEWILKRIKK